MNLKNISKLFNLSIVAILLTPTATFGYYTTAQHADAVTNKTALYTITYSFGLPEKDVYLPITTTRELVFADGQDTFSVGYSLTPSELGASTDGITTGLVLSSAPIVNNMYKVKAGTFETFTFVVVLTTIDTQPKAKYALQVNKLPFIVETSDGNKELRELNNHELGKYVTKAVGLNR